MGAEARVFELLSQEHLQGAESQIEQLMLKPIWNASVAGSSLICCTPARALRDDFLRIQIASELICQEEAPKAVSLWGKTAGSVAHLRMPGVEVPIFRFWCLIKMSEELGPCGSNKMSQR